MSEAISISQLVQEPANYAGETVSVRGFLYQAADGRWILASEPALKTCCVGSAEKMSQQILVLGDVQAHNVGVAEVLKGRFEMTSTSGLQLHDAMIATEAGSTVCPLCIATWILLGLGLVIAVYGVLKKRP